MRDAAAKYSSYCRALLSSAVSRGAAGLLGADDGEAVDFGPNIRPNNPTPSLRGCEGGCWVAGCATVTT